jgi:hypothetical protein
MLCFWALSIVFILGEGRTMDDNNSIKFNSINVYLSANLTAQRPITKLARVYRNKEQKSYSKK